MHRLVKVFTADNRHFISKRRIVSLLHIRCLTAAAVLFAVEVLGGGSEGPFLTSGAAGCGRGAAVLFSRFGRVLGGGRRAAICVAGRSWSVRMFRWRAMA